MDNEKKYKEALERARSKIKNDKDHVLYEDDVIEIFPELAESEDERIRKDIERAISVALDYSYFDKETANNCLAWLEKQGEQKLNPCDGCINRKGCINCENGELREVAHKPADKTKIYDSMDDLIADALIEEIESSELDDRGKYNRIHWIKSHRQNPAWSEEDETTKNNISHIIRQYDKISKREKQPCYYVGDCLLWMQNIKDRVQPQPNQEWNEEGKQAIEDAETWLDTLCDYLKDSSYECIPTVKEVISKLKSLRPQKQWKPSDEQINTLEYYMHTLICNEHKEILFGLYTDLKKLKG